MGRMMSPDPSMLEFADPTNPQSLNLYSYVLNNPLVNIDPDGLDCLYAQDSGSVRIQTGDCTNAGGKDDDGVYVNGTVNSASQDNNGNVTSYSTSSGSFLADGTPNNSSVQVTAQDPGVVGALPLETPQVQQQIDPIQQLAIGVNQQAGFVLNWGNAITGCAANHYILAPAAGVASALGAPVPKALVFGRVAGMGGDASRFMSGASTLDHFYGTGAKFTGGVAKASSALTGTARIAGAVGRVAGPAALVLDAALIANCVNDQVHH
jgi:hypothetical protein